MGTIRFTLAMLVVWFHVGGPDRSDLLPNGLAAVQLFYVISGFYMALVLNEKYNRPGMTWTFYSNRFFRLWPPMMLVAALTVLSFVLLDKVLLFHLTMDLDAFLDYLAALPPLALGYIVGANILVFGQSWMWFVGFDPEHGMSWRPHLIDPAHNGASFLINHPTFTVAIEATYYLISPLLLRRSVRWAIAIVALAFLFHVAVYLGGLNRVLWSYFFVGSAAYFYFLGVCAYHAYGYLRRLPESSPHWAHLARIELLLYPLGVVAAAAIWNLVPAPSMTMALVLVLVIPLLFRRTRHSRLDRIVGDLSYGIYLVHFPLFLLLVEAFGYGRTVAWLTMVLAVVGAALLYVAVELPIDRWRQRRAQVAARASAPAGARPILGGVAGR